MNERNAITKMNAGDIDGLAVIVEMYQVKAVRTAMLITRDKALAEDVVQATFIRIYKKIHQFDDTRPFEPWLMRSVVNGAIEASKKQQRTLSLHADVTDDTTFEDLLKAEHHLPHIELEADEERHRVRSALDKLSPEQRAAVVMRYYLDMSETEMSEELDTPKGTVKWRLYQARKRLKGLLAGIMPTYSQEVNNG